MLTPMDHETFESNIHAWLDDPDAPTAGERTLPPGQAGLAYERAVEEAGTHACGPDGRAFNVVLGVVGQDGVLSVNEVTTTHNVGCILGVLMKDPEVANVDVLGITLPEPEVTWTPSASVTSEIPGVAVTWAGGQVDTPRPRRSWLPWRR